MTYISQNITLKKNQNKDKIKVLLVDDSNVVLSIFERVLLSSGSIEIVGSANCANDALRLIETVKTDVILLDIEMPNRSGLDALPDIITKADGAKVIIVSSFIDSNGPSAIKALSLGACETLAKPGKNGLRGAFSEQLIKTVLRLGSDKVQRYEPVRECVELPEIDKPEAIFIGASTGGIPAIQEFLEHLSDDVTAPIFIAQHLPDAFISYFARQLSMMGSRKIISVERKVMVTKGHIYIASGDGHLEVTNSNHIYYATRLNEYENSKYTPSVDALFHSAANAYGSTSLALLMSGMGQDGADGARSLFKNEAVIWAQDQVSSVVWGMPGSIVNDGTSSAQLMPIDMARAVNEAYSA